MRDDCTSKDSIMGRIPGEACNHSLHLHMHNNRITNPSSNGLALAAPVKFHSQGGGITTIRYHHLSRPSGSDITDSISAKLLPYSTHIFRSTPLSLHSSREPAKLRTPNSSSIMFPIPYQETFWCRVGTQTVLSIPNDDRPPLV